MSKRKVWVRTTDGEVLSTKTFDEYGTQDEINEQIQMGKPFIKIGNVSIKADLLSMIEIVNDGDEPVFLAIKEDEENGTDV